MFLWKLHFVQLLFRFVYLGNLDKDCQFQFFFYFGLMEFSQWDGIIIKRSKYFC